MIMATVQSTLPVKTRFKVITDIDPIRFQEKLNGIPEEYVLKASNVNYDNHGYSYYALFEYSK
jgi:hypothetical protein